jgi:hypothetical protein
MYWLFDEVLKRHNIDWNDISKLNASDFEFIRKCAVIDVPNINHTGLKKGDYVVRRNKITKKLESNSKGFKIRYRIEMVAFNMVFARQVTGKNRYGRLKSINASSTISLELDQEYLDSIIFGSETFREESEIIASRKAKVREKTV